MAGDIVKPSPLHTESVNDGIAGTGLMVIVTVKVAPVQPPDLGVTV